MARGGKWLRVAADGCKWLQVAASSCKWLQVTAFSKIKMMHLCLLSEFVASWGTAGTYLAWRNCTAECLGRPGYRYQEDTQPWVRCGKSKFKILHILVHNVHILVHNVHTEVHIPSCCYFLHFPLPRRREQLRRKYLDTSALSGCYMRIIECFARTTDQRGRRRTPQREISSC